MMAALHGRSQPSREGRADQPSLRHSCPESQLRCGRGRQPRLPPPHASQDGARRASSLSAGLQKITAIGGADRMEAKQAQAPPCQPRSRPDQVSAQDWTRFR